MGEIEKLESRLERKKKKYTIEHGTHGSLEGKEVNVDLYPCLSCDSNNLTNDFEDYDYDVQLIECCSCDFRGPAGEGPESAAKNWNTLSEMVVDKTDTEKMDAEELSQKLKFIQNYRKYIFDDKVLSELETYKTKLEKKLKEMETDNRPE